MGCNVGLKVGKKIWTNILGFVELIAKNTMDQLTIDQIGIKSTKTLTPIEGLPQIKGNDLNMPFIHCFFLYFYFLFF